jgi:hypothetical protein
MESLIATLASSDSGSYTSKLQALQKMQDDLAYPDIAVAARNGWISHTLKVLAANPDPTFSRSFLSGVTVK